MVYYLTECMRDLLNILFSIIRFILATLTIAAIIIDEPVPLWSALVAC